jgi:hypothetical protein
MPRPSTSDSALIQPRGSAGLENPENAGLALRLVLLLDIRFERRFTPVLVRGLYVASLAFIGAVTLFGLLMSWWLASWAG